MPGGKPKALLAVAADQPQSGGARRFDRRRHLGRRRRPATYLGILQVYVSTLRRSLRAASDPAVAERHHPGARLQLVVDDALVDLGPFRPRGSRPATSCSRPRRYAEASDRLPRGAGRMVRPGVGRPARIAVRRRFRRGGRGGTVGRAAGPDRGRPGLRHGLRGDRRADHAHRPVPAAGTVLDPADHRPVPVGPAGGRAGGQQAHPASCSATNSASTPVPPCASWSARSCARSRRRRAAARGVAVDAADGQRDRGRAQSRRQVRAAVRASPCRCPAEGCGMGRMDDNDLVIEPARRSAAITP